MKIITANILLQTKRHQDTESWKPHKEVKNNYTEWLIVKLMIRNKIPIKKIKKQKGTARTPVGEFGFKMSW